MTSYTWRYSAPRQELVCCIPRYIRNIFSHEYAIKKGIGRFFNEISWVEHSKTQRIGVYAYIFGIFVIASLLKISLHNLKLLILDGTQLKSTPKPLFSFNQLHTHTYPRRLHIDCGISSMIVHFVCNICYIAVSSIVCDLVILFSTVLTKMIKLTVVLLF